MLRFSCIAALLLILSGIASAQAKPIALTWSEGTPNVTFNVYRWDSSQTAGFKKINTTPVIAMIVPCVPVVAGKICFGYTDMNTTVGTAYAYKVSAVAIDGQESLESVEADVTIAAPPLTPTGLKVTVVITN